MAKLAERLRENVPGDFYVDSSCIDCDACRQIAPDVFRDHGEQSSVYHQPETDAEVRRALMSLVACPTASIGTTAARYDKRVGIEAFPQLLAADVYCPSALVKTMHLRCKTLVATHFSSC